MSSVESESRIAIRRALVSVYDKAGLDDLVRGLHEAGVELVSTGGSAALIESLRTIEKPTQIEVNTVDAAQGREADMLIFSSTCAVYGVMSSRRMFR